MPFLSKPKVFIWTSHARAKMAFYKLSEGRVRSVLNSPRRVEEGVAPKTFAAMAPVSPKFSSGSAPAASADGSPKFIKRKFIDYSRAEPTESEAASSKRKETWNQEIWVMYQDSAKERVIISAWRYPGVTKVRSEIAMNLMRKEYQEFVARNEH